MTSPYRDLISSTGGDRDLPENQTLRTFTFTVSLESSFSVDKLDVNSRLSWGVSECDMKTFQRLKELMLPGVDPIGSQCQKIHNAPQFFVEGISRFDLIQGKVGNCWFLAALAALTMQEDLFVQVVPPNQDFQRNYCGIFHFRFWHFGDWVDVVVDDRLPVSERAELIFAKSCEPNEFWCALLEKAYAKLNGSYGDLHMGHISDALVDFTGGIKTRISLKDPPSDLWVRMKRAIELGSFMGCGTASENSRERTLPNGMVLTHAYTVTGVEEVPYKNRIEQLIRVRNPWGNNVEWNERWSDRSIQWTRVDPRIKENLLINREDGEFWMALQDFKRNFVLLVICNLTPDFLKGTNQQKWALSIHNGNWVKGQSAGGPMNNKEMFALNPQYCVTLTESDMDKETNSCSFVVCLLQKPSARWRHENRNSGIACFLFKVPPTFQVENGKLPTTLLDERYLVKRLRFKTIREVSETYELRPGTYVLVPCTYTPNEEKEFLLRAYYQRGSHQNHPNFNFNLHHPTPAPSQNDNSVWEQIFDKNAQIQQPKWSMPRFSWSDSLSPPLSPSPMSPTKMEARQFQTHKHHHSWSEGMPLPMSPMSPTAQKPEINAATLQKILNEVFLKGQPTLAGFSLDNCRGIVLTMDLSGTGRLDRHNFRRLWEKLVLFKDMFHQSDVEGTGFLRPIQLSNSLQGAGFEVTSSALNLMALRYGDSSGRITLESFINCFLRVEFATSKSFSNIQRRRPFCPVCLC
ncbi:calpain-11-like [Scyliorhinus canicula]|uniref:calpain-11-like n=1 Tax=Scyliorhinus canicula TaxID=7830 RepID=UPI0018F28505|nr:calpain-11-like [Scyliorhinus canicula]